MVLAYHGTERSEDELADLLETDLTGTAVARVHRLAKHGYLTVVHEATWEDLERYLSIGLPCIALVYTIHFAVHQGGHHTVVVVGIGPDTVFIHDPPQPTGPVEIVRASFEAAWEARRNRVVVVARIQTDSTSGPA